MNFSVAFFAVVVLAGILLLASGSWSSTVTVTTVDNDQITVNGDEGIPLPLSGKCPSGYPHQDAIPLTGKPGCFKTPLGKGQYV